MKGIRRIRRLAAAAAALAGALLAFAAAAPAALAWPDPPLPRGWQHTHPLLPPGHWTGPVYKLPARTVVAAGMPGWQIALVAAGGAGRGHGRDAAVDRARARRTRTAAAANGAGCPPGRGADS